MINFLTQRGEERTGPGRVPRGMPEYLDYQGAGLADRIRLLYYEDLPRQTAFGRGTYIISAFDQLTEVGQEITRTLTDALSQEPGQGIRILNSPARTLARFQLLSTLYQLGRNSFRVARVGGSHEGLRYPVFLRSEWQHHGALSPLLASPAEVERAVGELVLRGTPGRELLLVEFCDTADACGMYRKYAAFIVGDEILPRSLSYGSHWMLKHATSEFNMALAIEERDYILRNPHRDALREIFAVAGIEYGRVDYALRGDAIEVWEINLNPTIGRGRRPSSSKIPPELQAIRREGRDAFYLRFESALAAVDSVGPEGPPLTVRFDPKVPRGTSMVRGGSASLRYARAVFRTFRPVLQPVVRALFPLVGRLARSARPRFWES